MPGMPHHSEQDAMLYREGWKNGGAWTHVFFPATHAEQMRLLFKQAKGGQISWRTAICTAKRAVCEDGSCKTCSFPGAGVRWAGMGRNDQAQQISSQR